jgi:nitrite reductase/ring-hydroxylating ferredoxin subunit
VGWGLEELSAQRTAGLRFSECGRRVNLASDNRNNLNAVMASRRGRDHVVCRIDELPPGARRMVPVGKYGVGVFNVGGELFAITNYCPHQGGPLCHGRVQGTSVLRAGSVRATEYVLAGRVLRCPWHQWEFDLATGRTLSKPEKGVRTYPVRVESGSVILQA